MRIVYLSLAGIGDYLMQTSSIRFLKEKGYKIDLITMSGAIESLAQESSLFNNVYKFDFLKNPIKEFYRLYKLGKKEKYEVSVLGFPAYRKEYHIVQFLLGAKKRLYHRFKTGGFIKELHFLGTDYVYFDEKKHNVENNLLLLEKLGFNIDLQNINKNYILKIPEENLKFGENFIKSLSLENKDIIGIHPGSTNSKAALLRRWGWKKYVELIKKIDKVVFVFGGPDEKDDIGNMKKELKDNKNVFFIGESFLNSIAILSHVNLLICNDNGFGHIGAGLGIKVLSLWGTTNEKWSSPIGENITILKKTEEKPWYRYELKREVLKGAKSGMDEIKIEDVLGKVNLLLK